MDYSYYAYALLKDMDMECKYFKMFNRYLQIKFYGLENCYRSFVDSVENFIDTLNSIN